MIGEASGIVGRFESRLRQQRNHTIFPAFGSPLDFHYQLLAGARSNQIGGRSALARLLDYFPAFLAKEDRKSTRLNSSHRTISYAVFCLKKKKHNTRNR